MVAARIDRNHDRKGRAVVLRDQALKSRPTGRFSLIDEPQPISQNMLNSALTRLVRSDRAAQELGQSIRPTKSRLRINNFRRR
jgi:DNA-binding HxlR family transcriptional regulator